MPRRLAAPRGPDKIQRVSFNVARIWLVPTLQASDGQGVTSQIRCLVDLRHRHLQHFAWRQNHGAFDKVLEFPDIAWPRITSQRVHRGGGDQRDPPVHAARAATREVTNQQRDVFRPLPQGRRRNRSTIRRPRPYRIESFPLPNVSGLQVLCFLTCRTPERSGPRASPTACRWPHKWRPRPAASCPSGSRPSGSRSRW